MLRNEIAVRAGLPTQGDLIASCVGMLLPGVTVYRAPGLPLLIDAADANERPKAARLCVPVEDGQAIIDEPFPGTPNFETLGKAFDYCGDKPVAVAEVQVPAERMPRKVFYLPAILLLGFIVFLQRRRMHENDRLEAEAAT